MTSMIESVNAANGPPLNRTTIMNWFYRCRYKEQRNYQPIVNMPRSEYFKFSDSQKEVLEKLYAENSDCSDNIAGILK